MKKTIYFSLFFVVILLVSCVKDKEELVVYNYDNNDYAVLTKTLNLPNVAYNYDFILPPHLGGITINIDNNLATLGRVLFYDKRLSDNETVSCASCHKPELGFADDLAFSKGFNGEPTKRNSIAIASFPSFAAHYGGMVTSVSLASPAGLFWDGRASGVQEQTKETLRDPIEMGIHDINALGKKLIELDYYQILFEKAFPTGSWFSSLPYEDKITMSLEAFMKSIVAFDSRLDRVMQVKESLTSQENKGMQLFNNACRSCHNVFDNFSEVKQANNGLEMNYQDKGMGFRNGEVIPQLVGVFKIPSLRNIALTAPYMHDGRFATLEEVVEHYSSGIVKHPNLSAFLRSGAEGNPLHLNLHQDQKDALIAFLHTLTDKKSLLQEKYADPFR